MSFLSVAYYTIGLYLLVGMIVGIYVVGTSLARYFLAGWRIKEMMKTIAVVSLIWPIVVIMMIIPSR